MDVKPVTRTPNEATVVRTTVMHQALSLPPFLKSGNNFSYRFWPACALLNRALYSLHCPTPGALRSFLLCSCDLFLVKLIAGNEEVRVAILSALSAWISKAGEVLPSEVLVFFPAGLKEKENLRRAHLRCLRLAFRNGAMPVKVAVILHLSSTQMNFCICQWII